MESIPARRRGLQIRKVVRGEGALFVLSRHLDQQEMFGSMLKSVNTVIHNQYARYNIGYKEPRNTVSVEDLRSIICQSTTVNPDMISGAIATDER